MMSASLGVLSFKRGGMPLGFPTMSPHQWAAQFPPHIRRRLFVLASGRAARAFRDGRVNRASEWQRIAYGSAI
jgi:hypothetical protein